MTLREFFEATKHMPPDTKLYLPHGDTPGWRRMHVIYCGHAISGMGGTFPRKNPSEYTEKVVFLGGVSNDDFDDYKR